MTTYFLVCADCAALPKKPGDPTYVLGPADGGRCARCHLLYCLHEGCHKPLSQVKDGLRYPESPIEKKGKSFIECPYCKWQNIEAASGKSSILVAVKPPGTH